MISSIPEIIAEIQAGRMVILVDEEDRENEGDLVMAAEFVTPAAVNFSMNGSAPHESTKAATRELRMEGSSKVQLRFLIIDPQDVVGSPVARGSRGWRSECGHHRDRDPE